MTDTAPAPADNVPPAEPAPAEETDPIGELFDLLHLERTEHALAGVWGWAERHFGLVRPVAAAVDETAHAAGDVVDIVDPAAAPQVAAVEQRVDRLEAGLGAILDHLGIPRP